MSGNYSLIAEDENGCRSGDTVYIGFKSDPRADFGNDTTLCNNQSLLLQLSPRPNFFDNTGIYLWQNGSKADSFKVTQPGTYWGKITYQGCTVSDTIQVSYANVQSVSLGIDTTLCIGDSLLIKTNILNANYLWSTGDIGPTINIRNNGSFWVRVNNGSCIIADTVNVNFQTRPVLFLGNDTSLCGKEKIVLRAPATGVSSLWQDGSTQNLYEVTRPGLYYLKVTQNGCSVSDTISIRYNTLPALDLGADTGICVQQTILLNVNNSSISSYVWQDGSASPTFLVKNSGTYSVTVTGANGCLNKDTINIKAEQIPDFTLGNDTTLCNQQKLFVNLILRNAVYEWSTGNTANNYTITQPGLYWVRVTQNGCIKRDSITVNFKPLPIVNLSSDTTLCEGKIKLLNAFNTSATYQWQDMTSQPTLLATKLGSYYVTATLNGCIKKDSIQINYKYIPRFTLRNDTTLCTGEQLLLNPKIDNASFLWQNGSANATLNVLEAGIYKLTATNECGSSSDVIIISRGLCNLFVPNAFTPDNNGSNDIFRIKNPGYIRTFKMNIFNRCGQLVYTTENANTGWDGKYKGKEQPTGNYTWFINLITREGEAISKKGNLLLLR